MSTAIRIIEGDFGRVALLDMNRPLVTHAHSQCHVLLKADGADSLFQVRNKLHPLTENTAVLINAWEPHCYAHRTPGDTHATILALYIAPDWLCKIERNLVSGGHPGFFPQACVDLPRGIRNMANRLSMEMLYGEHLSDAYFRAQLSALMMAIIDTFSHWRTITLQRNGLTGVAHDHRIRRALAYMRTNAGLPLNVESLATQACLSRAHFFKLFQQDTHLTPNLYQNILRMNAAFAALSQTCVPLASLAEDLGFSAQSHFTRFFQQHAGVNPGQYRKVVDVHYTSHVAHGE